eukprot:TRINITY_DN924_c0_g1_i1.p1 TRINITY_DN924_c0_g1~~TRINITY_DN924_c0_g1_i1.p1  ORF type:complete len:244 (+),score=51.30 TRINITY_DN924_c0_g1_i1:252-983(+)
MELEPAKATYVPLSQQTYTDFVEEPEPEEAEIIPDYGTDKCTECWTTGTVEDARSGDVICSGCGIVKEARSISPEAEYRVFADDDGDGESKKRVGPSYNPLLPHNFLGSKRKWERDEKEFLWEGLKNIDDALSRLLDDGQNKPVEMRAKELFQQAFNWQFLQKQGIHSTVTAKITTPIEKKKMSQARRKYSRRKQFVVACIWWSLKEHSIDNIDVDDISELIDGKEVSKYSVRHCLRDLNLAV